MDPILDTDQYKFAMAEAGWPLREETFYYSHRKGGPHLLPVDVNEYVKEIFSRWMSHGSVHMQRMYRETREDLVRSSGLHIGAWFEHFYNMENPFGKLTIKTLPKGSWFYDRDPVFTITGPSFLLSWLEPQILQLNYRIQIATLAAIGQLDEKDCNMLTCEEQKTIVLETLSAVQDFNYNVNADFPINVQPEIYMVNVEARVQGLIDAVNGDAHRLFEVGLRAVTCGEQHSLVLDACKKAGLLGTSDTFGATVKNMKAVGTMGHEHVQRFGSDEAAYNAMADRLPGSIFCLLDTYDTYNSGFPAAYDLIKRQPYRDHAIRFDSGNVEKQFLDAVGYFDYGSLNYKVRFCLEDSWNLDKTKNVEKWISRCRQEHNYKSPWHKFDSNRVLYGYGGYIANDGWTRLTRDRVSAVWKLTQTGDKATMKFGGAREKGKESIPGKPVLWGLTKNYANLPMRVVAQEGEKISSLYTNLYKSELLENNKWQPDWVLDKRPPNDYSDATKILRHTLNNQKLDVIKRSKEKW